MIGWILPLTSGDAARLLANEQLIFYMLVGIYIYSVFIQDRKNMISKAEKSLS